ncbi:endonuclease NucS [Raineyella sp.]|uniref:endonuclease NucS n=1 Tax=Raineyella sp. TaxID=1911550 RepID=UPI002B1FE1F7|nr:endonuclease NucS [Raineyella sp.]MEA5155238.1 endonuclease NucS [Raineyella sp.]
MRLVIARCQVDYSGALTAHLPMANRLIMIKADGSVSVHADDRAYKPLNWMSAPCTMTVRPAEADEAAVTDDLDSEISEVWTIQGAGREPARLQIAIAAILHDTEHELGIDPGLQKDGVEAHLQELLAENPETFGPGWSLVRREYPTAIGPVDLLCRDADGAYVAVEVKRRGEIDGVEQLTRYLELMRRDPRLGDVAGVFAAQQIKPQARVLAEDRGISCVTVDYDALRGMDHSEDRLF